MTKYTDDRDGNIYGLKPGYKYCHHCGKVVKRYKTITTNGRTIAVGNGKRTKPHKCPHGQQCHSGDAYHSGNNQPTGCRECAKIYKLNMTFISDRSRK